MHAPVGLAALPTAVPCRQALAARAPRVEPAHVARELQEFSFPEGVRAGFEEVPDPDDAGIFAVAEIGGGDIGGSPALAVLLKESLREALDDELQDLHVLASTRHEVQRQVLVLVGDVEKRRVRGRRVCLVEDHFDEGERSVQDERLVQHRRSRVVAEVQAIKDLRELLEKENIEKEKR